MINEFFMLQELESFLRARCVERDSRERIMRDAKRELFAIADSAMDKAVSTAVQAGVDKRSADFINELRPRPGAFELTTDSGNTDFSTPPVPMLPWLLKNAKPMKDGSGVYKIIPVGGESKRPSISTSIFDLQKKKIAEQAEQLKASANRGFKDKPQFRTASSKQNEAESWVQPAIDKDFRGTLSSVNSEMKQTLEEAARAIIDKYKEAT